MTKQHKYSVLTIASCLMSAADDITLRVLQGSKTLSADAVLNNEERGLCDMFVSTLSSSSANKACRGLASSLAQSRGGTLLLATIMASLTSSPGAPDSSDFTKLSCEAMFAALMREEAEPDARTRGPPPGKRRKVRSSEEKFQNMAAVKLHNF